MLEVYSNGVLVDAALFKLEERPQAAYFIFQGNVPLLLDRVKYRGRELPSLVNKSIAPGAALVFPKPTTKATPSKVRAEGLLMRNGRVIRDMTTPELLAEDAVFERAYMAETLENARALIVEGRADGVDTYLRSRSFSDEAIRADLFQQANAKDS